MRAPVHAANYFFARTIITIQWVGELVGVIAGNPLVKPRLNFDQIVAVNSLYVGGQNWVGFRSEFNRGQAGLGVRSNPVQNRINFHSPALRSVTSASEISIEILSDQNWLLGNANRNFTHQRHRSRWRRVKIWLKSGTDPIRLEVRLSPSWIPTELGMVPAMSR